MSGVSPHNQESASLTLRSGRRQQTVAKPVEFRGRGLFHGLDVTAKVLPSDSDTGIVFRRVDLKDAPEIPATVDCLVHVPRRTALAASAEAMVETVEHLMAALAGLQVDNCVIEINAPEVPAYDGSCRDFCDGILEAGIVQLDADATTVSVRGTTTVRSADGRQSLELRPYSRQCLAITYQLNYGPHAPIAAQTHSAEITPKYFYEHISAARTFVLEHEIAALKQMGYGKHLTTKDLVVIGAQGTIDNELRFSDEAARHKLLDCVGDLALSGNTIVGHITACQSGHHLNHQLARVLSDLKKTDVTDGRNAA